MKIKYLGHKSKFPIYLPVGANTKGTIKKVIMADPYADLDDADAIELAEMFPATFALAHDSADINEVSELKQTKRRGRPAKNQEVDVA